MLRIVELEDGSYDISVDIKGSDFHSTFKGQFVLKPEADENLQPKENGFQLLWNGRVD